MGGLRAIEAGEIEALIFDAPILRYLIHHELKGGFEALPHTFHREDYGIALSKNSSLREPINRVLLAKILTDAAFQVNYPAAPGSLISASLR